MFDFFTGQTTCLKGRVLPNQIDGAGIYDSHKRRLAAFDRTIQAAEKCALGTDSDGDLLLIPEEELSIFLDSTDHWGELAKAVAELRTLLPIIPLSKFGFPSVSEDTLHESNPYLKRIGGGVEAWAYISTDHTIYKFFRPIGNGRIGASFQFQYNRDETPRITATHSEGTYRDLLEKIRLIQALGGVTTEIIAITPEGIVIVKQALGDILDQGLDVSGNLPSELIPIPSTFLRANRDHPRLFIWENHPWLVADLHARNFVRCEDGKLRVIDLIAAPWPLELTCTEPIITKWLENPNIPILGISADDEL